MNDFNERNYYEILELTPGASIDEIHTAYQRSLNTYNSDNSAMYSLLTDDECKEIVNKIEEAYSVIGELDKKIQYDKAKGFDQNNPMQRESFKPKNDFAYQEKNPVKESAEVTRTFAKSKFGLTFETNNEFEKEIENCTSFTGDFLRTIREYKNVSIIRMSDLTKVSKTHIKHIEEDQIEKLPADVYTRGFVYQYAKCLKLNPELVSKSYIEHTKELKKLLDE